jgi:serine/threonine-protein kinase
VKVVPVGIRFCSTCGLPLSGEGNCLACLLRIGFDEVEKETTSVFGDFEIARREDGSLWELGSGAMGITYRATDRVLHRAVALKVIETPTARADSRVVRERFLREARAAAALKHPNVANVFQFGAVPATDRCYYAMELVEGETLEALVRRDGPLEVQVALDIAIQVAKALTEAAAHSLVHRDLKPSNIMLTRVGSGAEQFRAKVIDFGLAKIANENGAMDLSYGGFIGTPSFASPEQFARVGADARSDIYSLGVTLWYALTGEVPCSGKTIEEIRQRQLQSPLPVQDLTERKVPAVLIDLLRRTLAIDPTLRPASARELLDALETCRARLARPNAAFFHHKSSKTAALILGSIIVITIFFAVLFSGPKTGSSAKNSALTQIEKSIAVLPFDDLSHSAESAAFAIGVQDEILSDLARIADLKVISRASVMPFANSNGRNLQEIGRTLGVANFVEGSVQRDGNRVRVVAELIDGLTGTHLWGETYDRDLSDVFAIQTEIAMQIARQLQAKVSVTERATISEKPTADLTAYSFYGQATDRQAKDWSPEKATELLQEALHRDPNFILAYCALARCYTDRYINENFSSDAHRFATKQQAKEIIDIALRLRPDRGEPHQAAAYNFFHASEFSEARRELAISLRLLPNDAEATFLDARLDRHENRWDDALVKARRAVALDPQNKFYFGWTSETYLVLRRYREGEEFVWQVKLRDPGYAELCDVTLSRFKLAQGDLEGARTLSANQINSVGLEVHFNAALYSRDYDGALKILSSSPLELAQGARVGKPACDWAEARLYLAMGDRSKAEKALLNLRQRLDAETPPEAQNEWFYSLAGEVDAGLQRKDEAIREARRATDLRSIAQDPINGTLMALRLALVYAWTRERDRAIEQLDILARMPSDVSFGDLRFNPDWDPLRGDPRFEEVVNRLAPKS